MRWAWDGSRQSLAPVALKKEKGFETRKVNNAASLDVTAAERRVGMLITLRGLAEGQPLQNSRSNPRCSSTTPPLSCAIKAQSTDWQSNEVYQGTGRTSLRRAPPRSQWKKISPRKVLLVEDNSDESFLSRTKTFTPRTQHHGAYVKRLGEMNPHSPLVRFDLYRDAHNIDAVRRRLLNEVNVQPEAVTLDEWSDAFGCHTQSGVAIGVSAVALRHACRQYHLHPLIIDPAEGTYPLTDFSRLTAPPTAREYSILLRAVVGHPEEIGRAMQRLAQNGCVNYFDISQFGCGSNTLYDMAAEAHREHYYTACGMYLQYVAEGNANHLQQFQRYVSCAVGSEKGILDLWHRTAETTREEPHILQFLQRLRSCESFDEASPDMQALWELATQTPTVPFRIETLEDCAAEFVWNAMVCQRLLAHGTKVVPGDLVMEKDGKTITLLTADSGESNNHRYTLADVVLPVPYRGCRSPLVFPTHSANEELYRTFSAQHRIDFLWTEPASMSYRLGPQYKPRPSYRRILCKPALLQWRYVIDPNSVSCLKTDLFLLQERRSSGEHEEKLRVPTPFNVSNALHEHMEPVLREARRHAKDPSKLASVAIKCVLPRGSHPTVMLREVFDEVTHVTSHGLLAVQP